MIPLRDENPTNTIPFVTLGIIAINILVFIYELSLGDQLQAKINQFAVIPYNLMHFTSPAQLLALITALFLHGGFAHILGNMLYLWVFGNNIEDRIGHFKFIFFYLACGIIATIGQALASPGSKLPMIGASGAISGVLGAYLILYPRAKILVLVPLFFIWRIISLPAFWFLFFWIIMQFFYGTVSLAYLSQANKGGVAWFAHIGGFLGGILLLKVFLKRRPGFRRKE